ncbi:MAG: ABC transporter permease subunit [Candidatus Zixiibacteriota bacterium]|nr:MAG: ABC transporter permease subunit [candidate division Zixibacteria bacterium]
MLRILVKKEVREILGSMKFVITFSACAVLILLSFYMGAENYSLSRAQHEAARAQNLEQLKGLTDWFTVRSQRVFLPPQPLATLVNGVSNDIGRTIEVEGRGELTADDSRYNDDPIFAIFRFVDLDFIFGTILSLFAILLGYNAISGEKEQGTLRLALANPIPRNRYILGKLLGSAIALILPLIVAMLIGCLMLVILQHPMSGEDWLRLIVIIITGLLYAGVFLTLSLFISSVTYKSSSSFLILLSIWIFGALIIPRASVLLAGRAVDVPSIDETIARKAKFSSQLFKEERVKMTQFQPTSTGDPEKMVSEFNRFMEDIADEREKKENEFNARINEDRDNKLRRQEGFSFNLARISPSTSMTLAATAMAGTSLELKDHFIDEALKYQKAFGDFMTEKTGSNPGGRMVMMKIKMGEEEEPEPIDPGELPVFRYQPVSLAQSVKSTLPDLGLLAVYNLIFIAGSFRAFGRYDLR